MAKKYHPDVNDDKNANYLFIQINEAYEALIDFSKRKKYDESLRATYRYQNKSNQSRE